MRADMTVDLPTPAGPPAQITRRHPSDPESRIASRTHRRTRSIASLRPTILADCVRIVFEMFRAQENRLGSGERWKNETKSAWEGAVEMVTGISSEPMGSISGPSLPTRMNIPSRGRVSDPGSNPGFGASKLNRGQRLQIPSGLRRKTLPGSSGRLGNPGSGSGTPRSFWERP